MKIILVIVTLLLSGCALTPIPYAPPLEGPTATVKFQNDAQKDLKITFYEESDGCKGRRTTPLILPNTDATYVIYAGKPFTFKYHISQAQYTDAGTLHYYFITNLRFVPEKDHDYLFRTTEDLDSCKWSMIDITQNKKPKAIKLKLIKALAGWDEHSSFCHKDSKSGATKKQ